MSELTSQLVQQLQADEPRIFFKDHFFSSLDLKKDAAKVQASLRMAGILPGQRVLLSEINSYGFLVAYLGILLHGSVVVPVNPLMPSPELSKVMARAFVHGAVVSRQFLSYVNEVKDVPLKYIATVLNDEEQFSFTYTTLQGTSWVEQDVDELPGELLLENIRADEGAILLYTSGTTGTPKGVLLTHGQVMATANHVIAAHRLTPDDICYAFLPLFHVNAQVIGFLSTLLSGGKMILDKKFSASRFWKTISEQRITWVSAVPTVIAILLKSDTNIVHPHYLRFVRSASAPLPELHAKQFEKRFGLAVIESYGMTEAASQICVNPVPPGVRKLGSVGLPAGVEVAIKDSNGLSLFPYEVGEIAICGDSIVKSYVSGDTSGSSFRDGWFYTGDIGYKDEDGYVFITGRSKEMINRAGQKITPREVEEVIGQDDMVQAVAVIGLPDELYGERVVAYIVPKDSPSEVDALVERLKDKCKHAISAYKCPAEYYMIDEIPVGPTGKIQRTRLKQQVLAENTMCLGSV